ncbi:MULTISPECIES: hypothetical protein [unclassified Rhizobacter]|uniref:hypothetical protein n=1 Tax=unclassified Rhizobacter TaxID=2640088 RepID=UPI000A46746B|nr:MULTISPECIES: hypothetical protein [unclassified Rhizobacter]
MRKPVKLNAIIGTFVLLSSTLCFAGSKENIEYVSLFGERVMVLGLGLKTVRLLDLEYPLLRCPKGDRYICVKSEVLTFAIPRAGVWPSAWDYDNAQYIVLKEDNLAFNGESLNYKVIRQTWRGQVVDYIYSAKRGVIAIKAKDGEQLTLSTACGFAAASTNRCQ